MGESQSKFCPDPKDVWSRTLIKPGRQPRFLPTVLQVIVKEPNGISEEKIIDQVEKTIEKKSFVNKPKGLRLFIKSALKYGTQNNLIKLKRGKFVLSMSRKEYAKFKSLLRKDPLTEDVNVKNIKKGKKRHKSNSKGVRRCRKQQTLGCCKMTDSDKLYEEISNTSLQSFNTD